MEKEEFQRLLSRYLNGECSKEEHLLLDQWFDRIAKSSLQLNESERIEMEERIDQTLQRVTTSVGKKNGKFRVKSSSLKYSIAAILVLILTLTGVLIYTKPYFLNAKNQITTISKRDSVHENVQHVVEVLVLPDGSKVSLQPGGRIEYGIPFGVDKREIKLIGTAFFDVVKNPKRPFYVYSSNSVTTKVLGTSFYVKAPRNSSITQVEVKTGRVAVYKDQKSDKSVVLTRNQKVTYYKNNNQWVTGLVDLPQLVHSEQLKTSFLFDNTPLREIIKNLENDYGIEISVSNQNMMSCTFTGDVSGMSLYDALTVITSSIRSTYEIQGTKILIHGNGCD